MAQVGTGAEGNAAAGRVQLENDQFVGAGPGGGPGTYSVRCGPRDQVPTELIVRNSTGRPAR